MPSDTTADHILVVDDLANWRKLLTTLLEGDGFQVSVASSVEKTKSILAESTFDLVVLDVRLDDENEFDVEGLALLCLIKADSPASSVILLTGYPESIKGKHEADAVLLKAPFNIIEFRKRVRELVKASPRSPNKN